MLTDRLDEMNRKNSIHKNLIKWWDVNLLPAETNDEEISSEVEMDDLSLDELELVTGILNKNDNQNAFEKAREYIDESNLMFSDESSVMQNESVLLANEIYERLMREEAEDAAIKQAEIEQAKLLANS